jgi:hypothetical protein
MLNIGFDNRSVDIALSDGHRSDNSHFRQKYKTIFFNSVTLKSAIK